MHRPHRFCPYCGRALPGGPWPRTCHRCAQSSYLNPAPVVVLLLPVGTGLLAVRRGIDPGRGQLALPGGFIDLGESWQQACARELAEETGVRIGPDEVSLLDVQSTERHLLVLGKGPHLDVNRLPPFVANAECTERLVLTAPAELAFPLHTQAARRFFNG